MSGPNLSEELTRVDGGFETTLWTVVLQGKEKTTPQAEQALARLCQIYWYPLYAYTRRSGVSEHDAQDLTQEFFARFLEKEFL